MRLIRRVSGRRAPERVFHLSPVRFQRFEQQWNQPHIGFHFGSKETAFAVADKLQKEGRVQPGDTLYLYEVTLDAAHPLVFEEDALQWRPGAGAWTLTAILRKLFERDDLLPGFTEEDQDAYFEDELLSPSGENLKDLGYDRREELREFAAWFNARGYDSIAYENTFEGGGTSYIVFRPEQIRILDVTTWTLP